ncbi:S-adenosyl-L-methionine-dependent methyltransferase [Cadophora sp. MPI-SDFR-AT-0126]|nr:S-adenosyl-L-methionine-dependent methyltransferase [Leotiomycetes sp. MPI-SDFR-AT-0126]
MAPTEPEPAALTLVDIFWHLIDPLMFLAYSASYLPLTIFSLVRTQQFSAFASPARFKDAWFARFWGEVGPQSRENALPRVGPLIAEAKGVVLDIGAGYGEWVRCFDKKKVTKIYGVEPNVDQHPKLRERVKEAGLEDIYVIVPVGVEDLGEKWVKRGEVDTIVTIQCLCSVSEPKKMIGELYVYLKDGGSWILYEHVVVFPWQGWFLKWWQATIDLIWPHFLGGCSITRDSGKWLKEAGSWEKVDLKQPSDELFCHVIPHIIGTLTK